MVALFKNNAYSTLASGVTDVALTLSVASGEGARFPSPTGTDFFYATLIDTSNNLEIIKVTTRSTDTFTIVREQESTTARAYSTSDRIELRITAAGLDDIASITAGTQTIWIPAAAMRPTSSNGCAAITDVETTSGRPDLQVLDFDTSADEHAQFQIGFPKSWNEGTITFRVFWTVAWGLQGVSVANDATIDVAYGTAIVVTDDNISAAEDCLVTATSSAVTIASAAVDTMTFFRIFRDISDGNDDMAEDARLLGVQIFFTTDAVNDA